VGHAFVTVGVDDVGDGTQTERVGCKGPLMVIRERAVECRLRRHLAGRRELERVIVKAVSPALLRVDSPSSSHFGGLLKGFWVA
jgi:hypothetical protein